MKALRKIAVAGVVLALISLKTSCTGTASTSPDETTAVSSVLDDLHLAASEANGDKYFGCFSEDAVFFGTDATERWTIKEFRAYAEKRFNQGKGWTYHVTERNIFFADDQKTAWFDERLNNENFGDCRGTGVLEKQENGWKIAQYNLAVPIPNDLAKEIVQMIRAHDEQN